MLVLEFFYVRVNKQCKKRDRSLGSGLFSSGSILKMCQRKEEGIVEREPKILIYDVEVSPMLIWAFGEWDTNSLRVEQYSYMFCFSYKWFGERKTTNVAIWDFPVRYKADPTDDKDVVKELHRLMSEADIVVAHNARRFDNRVAEERFLYHDLGPPAPYKTVDTLQVARRYFKHSSNALDSLGVKLKIGRKTNKRYGDMWYGCVMGVESAKRWMSRYNNQDVRVLERLYKKLRPWITNHPNMAVLSQRPDSCPKCGGKHLISKGTRSTNAYTYQRFRCKDCGGWTSDRKRDPDYEKSTYVNFNA